MASSVGLEGRSGGIARNLTHIFSQFGKDAFSVSLERMHFQSVLKGCKSKQRSRTDLSARTRCHGREMPLQCPSMPRFAKLERGSWVAIWMCMFLDIAEDDEESFRLRNSFELAHRYYQKSRTNDERKSGMRRETHINKNS